MAFSSVAAPKNKVLGREVLLQPLIGKIFKLVQISKYIFYMDTLFARI